MARSGNREVVIMGKFFILYDGRAKCGNPDDAVALDTVESEEEAREYGEYNRKGYDAIWFEYDEDGEHLINATPRYDLPPCSPVRKRKHRRRRRKS